jgi:hydrogenase expression/formation protein HypC
MCLSVPGLITKVEGGVVTLDVMGSERTARLDLLGEPVQVGQFVLHQLGFVTAVLDEHEARETLKLFEQVLASVDEDDAVASVPARA